MNRNDESRARRAQVELLADTLAAAVGRRDAIVRHMLDQSDGEPVRPPPLELYGLSRDTLETLLRGLRAALDGGRDPFGIAAPRGISPALERKEAIEAVAALLNMRDLGEPVGAAIAAVAARYYVSEEQLRKLYQEEDIRGWADLLRNAY